MARGATKTGADAGNAWRLSADQSDGDITLHLAGPWTLQAPLPPAREVESQLPADGTAAKLLFETGELAAWDSSLLTFLISIEKLAKARGMTIDRAGLPAGIGRLLDLASAVPERAGARRSGAVAPWLQRVGTATIAAGKATSEMIGFVGEAVMAFGKLFTGRARFRGSDLMLIIQDCGASALGIVTLISILVGLILAFVGAIQLELFGAQIFVADLVGIATVREMGAMMTAIVMAGRTDDELLEKLEASRSPGKWHNSIRDAIATMIGRGWSDPAIKLACAPYCQGGANDPDLVPLIDGARGRWNKPNEERAGHRSTKPRFVFETVSDLRSMPDHEYLVGGWIPENSVGLLYGRWGSGKTFIGFDLALHLVFGLPDWHRQASDGKSLSRCFRA